MEPPASLPLSLPPSLPGGGRSPGHKRGCGAEPGGAHRGAGAGTGRREERGDAEPRRPSPRPPPGDAPHARSVAGVARSVRGADSRRRGHHPGSCELPAASGSSLLPRPPPPASPATPPPSGISGPRGAELKTLPDAPGCPVPPLPPVPSILLPPIGPFYTWCPLQHYLRGASRCSWCPPSQMEGSVYPPRTQCPPPNTLCTGPLESQSPPSLALSAWCLSCTPSW